MTKNSAHVKKLLAVSASVALLGSIAATGLAGTSLFRASAEGEDPNKLILETVDEFSTVGYKIEEANANNSSQTNPYDSPDNPYDYIVTVTDSTNSWWSPYHNDGKIYYGNTEEAVWNITTQSGKSVLGLNFNYKNCTKRSTTDGSIGGFTYDNNNKLMYIDAGDKVEGSDNFKCGEAVIKFYFRSNDNNCATHGEAPCTCSRDGEGQGEDLTNKTLRILYRVVHIEDQEFTYTGVINDANEKKNGAWITFGANDVLGVSKADDEWNHAQRFFNGDGGSLLPFFQNIYFLEKTDYDISTATTAPTSEQLAGKDLYSLMTGDNDVKDGLLFETHVRNDHIELELKAKEGAGSQEGTAVNFKAGDCFYLKQGLQMLGKDGNGNWCIASEGGSKNILARDQFFSFDGESWSSDEFSVTLNIDKTKAKAEVDGATDTIVASLVTGKFATEGENTVTWTSSDETVATVNGGVVTGVKAGTATITASLANGSFKTCTVTVVNADEITGVKLNKSNNFTVYTSGENNTFQLTATVEGGSKAPQAVTWESADPTIATVDANGLVTGVKAGSTKITCTAADGTTKATVNVNVKEAAVVDPGDDDNKDDDNKDDNKGDGKSGCGSVISGSVAGIGIAVVAVGAAFVAIRKKNANK